MWLHILAASAPSNPTPAWLVLVYYFSAVIIALSTIVFGFIKFILPVVKFFNRFRKGWDGEEARPADGFAGSPGVMKRLSTIEYHVDSISAELHPNHGSPSMREQVNELVEWKRASEK